MVFAPVNPTSLACAAIPLFAAAGNPWARLPQVRLERAPRCGSACRRRRSRPRAATSAPVSSPSPTRERYPKCPYLQARVAVTSKSLFGSGKPGSRRCVRALRPVTGHSERRLAQRPRLRRRGARLEPAPRQARARWREKRSSGRNLAGFQAGVFQGINPDAVRRRRHSGEHRDERRVGPDRAERFEALAAGGVRDRRSRRRRPAQRHQPQLAQPQPGRGAGNELSRLGPAIAGHRVPFPGDAVRPDRDAEGSAPEPGSRHGLLSSGRREAEAQRRRCTACPLERQCPHAKSATRHA